MSADKARKSAKLSDAQRAMLIRAVERDGCRIHGAGAKATAIVLVRLGLIHESTIRATPTTEGRKLVESWRCAACGHLEYHCPASGCNHYDKAPPDPYGDAEPGEAATIDCDCEEFVPRAAP